MTLAINYFFPSFAPPGTANEEKNSFKSRFSCNWRMIPPLCLLVLCVGGVAALILKQNYFWALPPGVGVFISIHTLYLAQQYPHLKSFSANNAIFASENQKLEQQVGNLNEEIEDLRQAKKDLRLEVSKLESENKRLEQSTLRLENQLKSLESSSDRLQTSILNLTDENRKFKDENSSFKSLIDELQSIKESLSKEVESFRKAGDKQRKELASINDLLSKTVISAQQDHATFASSVESIQSIDSDMQNNLSTLNETTSLLKGLFETISLWKDQEEVTQRLDEVKQLQSKITSHEFALKELVQELGSVKKALADEREKFAAENQKFQQHLKRLEKVPSEDKKES